MESLVLETAVTQGLFAVLFVVLLFWLLRENAKREAKYQDVIDKLSDNFKHLESGILDLNTKVDKLGGEAR